MSVGEPTPLSPPYWNGRYAEEGFAYGEAPNVFLAASAGRIRPGGRVLVPGDGEGRNGVWLAQQGFEVTSVDMSEVGCEKARQLAADRGVSLGVSCADLLTWGWPRNAYDAVVSIFLHVPIGSRPRLHRLMRDALVPSGLIVIEAFSPAHLEFRARQPSVGGPGSSDLLYSLDTLRADFAPLTTETGEEIEVELREGRYHHGRAAVTRAIFSTPRPKAYRL